MPYELTWLDGRPRILSLRLFDPFGQDEIDSLRSALKPVLAEPPPLFVLLEIETRNTTDLINQAMASGDDGDSVSGVLSDLAPHLESSRLAIVGGGAPVKAMIGLYRYVIGQQDDLVRVFAGKQQALEWLREQAGQAE